MRRLAVPVLGVLVASAALAVAQEASGPPNVLIINREEIKPGKGTLHDKSAISFVSVISRTPAQSYRLALRPVTGDDNSIIYLEGHDSFAALETARKQFDEAIETNAALKTEMEQVEKQGGDLHASQKTAIYRHRADLSYRPHKMDTVARSRVFSITTTRVKPGRGPDYVEYLKALNAAREKANIDVHSAVYQVASGAPMGTFVTFSIYPSMSAIDELFAKMDERNKAVDAALGGEEVVKKRRMLISEVVSESTNTLYDVNRSLSRPSEAFVAYDAEFWQPKGTPAKALATKKEIKKQ